MVMKCPMCKGKGKVKRRPLTADEVVFTLGIAAVMTALIEGDRDDDRFWKDCRVCKGDGYVRD